jgi:hypothetical protein
MALSMADRPPAIDVLYPEAAPSIFTGSGTRPTSLIVDADDNGRPAMPTKNVNANSL